MHGCEQKCKGNNEINILTVQKASRFVLKHGRKGFDCGFKVIFCTVFNETAIHWKSSL